MDSAPCVIVITGAMAAGKSTIAALATMVGKITTRPRHVVVLAPRVSVLASRDAGRSKRGYGEWTPEELDRSLREETPRLGLWVDNSDQTPAGTVDAIMTGLSP